MEDNKLIVTEYKGFDACFEYKAGSLCELILTRFSSVNVNDIFVGRVSAVKDDIKACFVDISPDNKGFLPFKNIYPNSLLSREFDGRLKQGDLVAVQVTQDKIKTKEYGLSMRLTIPGAFSVITFDDKNIHFSSKLNKLQISNISETLKNNEYEYGFVVRTNADVSFVDSLLTELKENCSILKNIDSTMRYKTLYTKLYSSIHPLVERIKSIKKTDYSEIVTDSKRLFEELSCFDNVRFYDDERISLKTLYSFEKAFLLATDRKVNLDCGGYLIIEPTEAMTVIDVNSGKFDKKTDKESAAKMINMQACSEVCRQIRLRNLSGIIIVDFINMKKEDNLSSMLSYLKSELKKDALSTNLVDVTALGLVEITREKRYQSIYDAIRG